MRSLSRVLFNCTLKADCILRGLWPLAYGNWPLLFEKVLQLGAPTSAFILTSFPRSSLKVHVWYILGIGLPYILTLLANPHTQVSLAQPQRLPFIKHCYMRGTVLRALQTSSHKNPKNEVGGQGHLHFINEKTETRIEEMIAPKSPCW